MRVQVIGPSRKVIVDGVSHVCLPEVPADFRVLTWDDANLECPGYGETEAGAKGFRDRSRIEPFVALWRVADVAARKEVAEQQAARDAEKERIARENERIEQDGKKAAAEFEARKPMYEAMNALSASDHEVIKAMEAKLASEGALSSVFVKGRQDLRSTVKAERARLAKKD
jgi:hypothetical protein